jgi:hypothetical protein
MNLAKKFLTAVADRAYGVSQHHDKRSKAHAAMADGLEKGSPEHAFHKSAVHEHADESAKWAELGETCAEWANKCGKADGDQMEKLFGMDDDRLVPSAVSVVAPDAPRAIPRFGSPQISKTDVDPAFRKMVAVNDEEEE